MKIDYIVNSKKPYPDFIKTHKIFTSISKIEKIFPLIGLPNFKEEIEIFSTEPARISAVALCEVIVTNHRSILNVLRSHFTKNIALSGRDRNELCNNLQYLINVGAVLDPQLGSPASLPKVVENKVSLSINSDIFSGADSAPLFKKGEAVFRVLNKFNDLLKEVKVSPALATNTYEASSQFKEFSKLNIPSTKYDVYFSSEGEEGAWDIATASMRGITSCQGWHATQSRALIGSITSKFVGVMYVASKNERVEPYGSKMLFRCMVRIIFNKKTGVPAIFLDKMYMAADAGVLATFKSILKRRSGLEVFASSIPEDNSHILANYQLYSEETRKMLVNGEFSYLDTAVPLSADKMSIFATNSKTNGNTITQVNDKIIKALNAAFTQKRSTYTDTANKINEFYAAKAKWEMNTANAPSAAATAAGLPVPASMQAKAEFTMEKPTVEAFCKKWKKGENAYKSILNFFNHCDKNHGKDSSMNLFLTPILTTLMKDNNDAFKSDVAYKRALLRRLMNKDMKAACWTALKTGSWMDSFAKSSERFFETVMEDLKKHLFASIINDVV